MTSEAPAPRPADALRAAFDGARSEGRAALLCYLPAGFPTMEIAEECLVAAAEAGADVLEVGFPYSDPIMDGPLIQAAAQAALEQGVRVDDDLALCARLARRVTVPVVAMTYYSLADVRGLDRFASDCAAAGVAGVILADLPAGEAGPWVEAARAHALATVFLAAPVSSDERLDALVSVASGFVYATSVLGVTGVRVEVADARALVARLRARTDLPVAVGIGVSDAAQASDVASYADGVIVGSAIVRAAGDGDAGGAARRVGALVSELRAAVGRGEAVRA